MSDPTGDQPPKTPSVQGEPPDDPPDASLPGRPDRTGNDGAEPAGGGTADGTGDQPGGSYVPL